MARAPVESRIAVVLVEPREEGNVGAAARAMKNAGLSHLRLVRPCPLGVEARKLAWRSLDILSRARTFATLDAALADCARAIGFTARPQRRLGGIRNLPEAARAILAHADRGRVALVFGPEHRGLTRDELSRCHDVARIPASPRQPTLNLAQAVVVVGYELLVARLGGRAAAASGATRTPRPPATQSEIVALEQDLRRILQTLGYGEPRKGSLAERILRRWRAILDRAGLDHDDVQMFHGLAARIAARPQPPHPLNLTFSPPGRREG